MAPRTVVYVDGFNLYCGALQGTPDRWLNLQRYFELLLSNNDLVRIRYFTAVPNHDPGKKKRHETYLAALRTLPLVDIYEGRFKRVRTLCTVPACTLTPRKARLFKKREEKRTDVNIAASLELMGRVLGRQRRRLDLVRGHGPSSQRVG